MAKNKGKIVKVAGPLIVAEGLEDAKMFDVVRVSSRNLIGEVIEMRGDRVLTRVAFHPLTGRTHQLRLHAAKALHPIVGDRLYGRQLPGERLCLHAESLTIKHPVTGEAMTFTAPVPF